VTGQLVDETAAVDTERRYDRIRGFLDAHRPPTPCLAIDLRRVEENYRELCSSLSGVTAHYAVKACPEPAVLTALASAGAAFDIASPGELDLCLGLGIPADRIAYGNTIKKQSDIAYAYGRGVGLYTFDCEVELRKLAAAAPGAQVVCRLMVDGSGAHWPLSRKFGCDPAEATSLLRDAVGLGLEPAGISFHVGSQQPHPGRWTTAIHTAASIFESLRALGVHLRLLNLGGGFPARYLDPVPPLRVYGEEIAAAIAAAFPGDHPQLISEPGRSLVADAGVLRSEVVLVSRKNDRDDCRWVYLDVGRFSGLAETEAEAITYPIRTSRDGGSGGPVILAGPSCDSVDVLYERRRYELPLDLTPGDTLDFLAAGAYTTSYATASFNGFPPPATHCLP
jgi:ornithine decarboxylase